MKVREKLVPGDVIRVSRLKGMWYHYGIYVGNSKVVDYCDPHMDPKEAIVHHRSILEFSPDLNYELVSIPKKFPNKIIVKRALHSVGKGKGEYNMLTNNCEHFVYKICVDKPLSPFTMGMYHNLLMHKIFIPRSFSL